MERDNQQVRDIGWLAGIFDGEGCISLQRRTLKTRNNRTPNIKQAFDLIPDILLVNTNWVIIDEVDRLLKEFKVGHYIFSQKNYTGETRRPKWCVRISGWFRCKAFLVLVGPYLRGKYKEAEVLHEYICSRLSHPQKCHPYTEDEVKVYDILRTLKTMSNPNDYTLDVFIDKTKI